MILVGEGVVVLDQERMVLVDIGAEVGLEEVVGLDKEWRSVLAECQVASGGEEKGCQKGHLVVEDEGMVVPAVGDMAVEEEGDTKGRATINNTTIETRLGCPLDGFVKCVMELSTLRYQQFGGRTKQTKYYYR